MGVIKNLKLFLIVIVVSLFFCFSKFFDLGSPEKIRDIVDNSGCWGGFVFMGIYMMATIMFIPCSLLTVLAGFLFGIVVGVVYVLLGAMLGSVFSFCLSRYLFGELIRSMLNGKVRIVDKYEMKLKENGVVFVFLVRLIPLFSFSGLNYSLGLTSVKFKHYLLGTFLGIIPVVFIYVFLGSAFTVLLGE